MTIKRASDGWEATCDECGDLICDGADDFRECVEEIKAANGQLIPVGNGDWEHRCSDCRYYDR